MKRKKQNWLFYIEPLADYRPFSLIIGLIIILSVWVAYFCGAFIYLDRFYAPAHPNWSMCIIAFLGMAIMGGSVAFGHHLATIIDILLFDIPRLIKQHRNNT